MTTDFLVIGGGVIGLSIASEWKRRRPDSSVVLLEKEEKVGLHASGRNSGVLHAGFYYSADSMKARFTRIGNSLMTAYCESRGLPIHRCGKLVIAQNESELDGLEELKRRGDRNGVKLEMITEAQAREIEPRVKTWQRALWSPNTSTVNPALVMASMAEEAERMGIRVSTGTVYQGHDGNRVRTSAGLIEAGYVVNAAGLYADHIAREWGFCRDYQILPFKGLYLYSSEPPGAFRTNIYPVPNLKNPFLGVHFTVTVDGKAKIGPTAIPCLWREQYDFRNNFRWSELAEIFGASARLFIRAGFDFRGLALEEVKKYSRAYLVAQSQALANGVELSHYTHWGKPGIRAQLFNTVKRTLEMDFCIEGDDRSCHVLNAVSPAFTCSLSFSQHVCDQIDTLTGATVAPTFSKTPV